MNNLVLILGSNGFVGNALVRKFILEQNYVIGIGRSLKSIQTNQSYVNDSNFKYFSLGGKSLLCLESKLKNFCKNIDLNMIFINSAWSGDKKISDGDFNDQLKNIFLSSDAISIAAEIGCKKFINIGSVFENYIDKFINENWYQSNFNFENQIDYSLAKNICRDFNKLVSYLQKIDYIHCSFSVFIDSELSGGGYIPTSLKKISRGLSYKEPDSEQLFDLTFLDEGCKAIFLLSQKGKINKSYYIGTSLPRKLKDIFSTFKAAKLNLSIPEENCQKSMFNDLFDTSSLIKDIGYKPSKTFNKFALDFFKC